jgi:hypothetical protein
MLCPRPRVSAPMACPTRYSRSRSQVAPRAAGTGKQVAGARPSSMPTPRGPSRNFMPRMPRRSLSFVMKLSKEVSDPAIWSIFSASDMSDSTDFTWGSVVRGRRSREGASPQTPPGCGPGSCDTSQELPPLSVPPGPVAQSMAGRLQAARASTANAAARMNAFGPLMPLLLQASARRGSAKNGIDCHRADSSGTNPGNSMPNSRGWTETAGCRSCVRRARRHGGVSPAGFARTR